MRKSRDKANQSKDESKKSKKKTKKAKPNKNSKRSKDEKALKSKEKRGDPDVKPGRPDEEKTEYEKLLELEWESMRRKTRSKNLLLLLRVPCFAASYGGNFSTAHLLNLLK